MKRATRKPSRSVRRLIEKIPCIKDEPDTDMCNTCHIGAYRMVQALSWALRVSAPQNPEPLREAIRELKERAK